MVKSILNDKNNDDKIVRHISKRVLSTETADYEDAVKKLNSLQSNAATINLSQNQGPLSHVLQATKVESTTKYLSRIGVSLDQLDELSIVHIAGTKGKGTTAALCESILRRHGYRTGFFSSPHLVHARERIRLNGKPLTPRQFTDYLDFVYSRLWEKKDNETDMPAYFKFLTIMAYHVFLKEKVDVGIVEVGIGGEYDCTNCIRKPSVVGVTMLGLDHTQILGTTLPDIAWQKSGIFKTGTRAFTVPQSSPAAMDVLRERAANRQCSLKVAPPLENYSWDAAAPLGFSSMVEDVYSTNASLALQLAHSWLQQQSPFYEPEEDASNGTSETVPLAKPLHITRDMAAGLDDCHWPGRTQIIKRDQSIFFLDGAHTEDSIDFCIRWFLSASNALAPELERPRRVLIFNITGSRDADRFLQHLIRCDFDDAIFSGLLPFSNQTDSSDQFSILNPTTLTGLQRLSAAWKLLHANGNSMVCGTMSEALEFVAKKSGSCHVLVTGSIHLVGAALSILDPDLTEPVIRIPATLMPLQNKYSGFQAVL